MIRKYNIEYSQIFTWCNRMLSDHHQGQVSLKQTAAWMQIRIAWKAFLKNYQFSSEWEGVVGHQRFPKWFLSVVRIEDSLFKYAFLYNIPSIFQSFLSVLMNFMPNKVHSFYCKLFKHYKTKMSIFELTFFKIKRYFTARLTMLHLATMIFRYPK